MATGVGDRGGDRGRAQARPAPGVGSAADADTDTDTGTGTVVVVGTAEEMVDLGRRLAPLLHRGDLVVLSGELGSGKTTLTRGLGEGLGVRGPVTSPTFVIAREHPSLGAGPALVHVDAYRLGDVAEVEDLDLDASLAESVTVVEWGTGFVEGLAGDRLEIRLHRPRGHHDGQGEAGQEQQTPRTVSLRGVGPRWAGVPLPGGA